MDPIDQFFRNKLEERRYEYHDAYWEEAERMIEQREGRRRRAFWWWVFGMALLLVSLGAAAWWGLSERHEIQAFRIDIPAVTKGSLEETLGLLPKEQVLENANVANPQTDTALLQGPRVGGGAIRSSEAAQAQRSLHQADNATEKTGPGGQIPTAPSFSGASETKEPLKSKEIPARAEENSGKDSAEVLENRPVALQPGEKMDTNTLLTLLAPAGEQPPALGIAPSASERPIRPRKLLDWELAVAATLNPSDGKTLVGGVAGLRTSYRLRENMLLALGASYRLRGGTFGPSSESRTVAYRFGREEERYRLQPNRLHYAEAALHMEWRIKRHRLALGVGWNYLLGIEGSLSRSVKEEFALSFGATASQEKGWLEEDGYKKQFWVGRAAYHYQIHGRWSLGLDLQYIPGGILQKENEVDPGAPLLRETGPVIIDLGLKYRL